ncbi:M48 family metalloprotease [Streptomyces sp. NPDC058326]|uniref:M48 family metalloprotease n=1 Tax=Streptomyces sp. NPDC058326 TaxID=3346447 RepID=UPI0036E3EEF8
MTVPAAPPQLRPDPFAVTSGTTLRFGLLVLAMSAAASTTGGAWTGWLLVDLDALDPVGTQQCLFRILEDLKAGRSTPPPEQWEDICGGPSIARSALVNLLPLALFWLAVLALYWFRPALRIRRRGLRPFPAAALPATARELDRLCRVAGVPETPVFLVDLLAPAATGLAFGRRGRRYVMLSRGLLQLYERDPAAFRAIVLHELAHLRNRDVDIAFLTDAAWRLYLWFLLLPALFSPLTPLLSPGRSGPLLFYLLSAFQLALVGVIIPLARKSVLRSRELHADARAALTAEGAEGLRKVLTEAAETQPEPPAPPPKRRRRAGGAPKPPGQAPEARERDPDDMLSTHPHPRTRLRALADTGLLFRFGPGSALAFGIAASFSYEPVIGLSDGLPGLDRSGALAVLPLALILGAGLTLALWRVELAAFLMAGRAGQETAQPEPERARERIADVGRLLGFGLALGSLGSNEYALSLGSVMEISPPTLLLSLAALAAGGQLVVWWVAGTARAWVPVALTARRPRVVLVFLVCCAVPLIALWLAYLLQLATWTETLGTNRRWAGLPDVLRFPVAAVVYLVPNPPLAMTGLMAAVALVPMLGGVLARRAAAKGPVRPDAYLLGPTPAGWRAPEPEPGPGAALRAAAWTGGGGAVLCWAVHVLSALFAPELLLWSHFLHGLALAGLVQVVLALVVARRTRARAGTWGRLHGLLAAALAGPLLHLGLLVSRDHFGCLHWGFDAADYCRPVPTSTAWWIALQTQWWGLIAAAVALLLGAALARRSKRRAGT